MPQLTDKQMSGDVPSEGQTPGVAPMTKAPQPELMPFDSRTEGEKVNEQLTEEIKQKILAINPDIFKGVVEELADLIEDFKVHLPTFEMLQYTQPDAYNNLLSILGTLSMLAQLMLQNGDLPTDQSVVSEVAEQQIAANAEQAADESQQKTSDDGGLKKTRQSIPVGTIRNNGANGRPRIKTAEGWKYISAGLGASVGRQKTNYKDN